jgi:tetratricopeptide (TPR) repeat protein
MPVARIHRCLALLAAVLPACVTLTARAQDAARDLPPPTQLKDLDYGDVLFYFFQDDYFDSLVRLEVSRDFQRIPHHEAEAELLSGGLYLSLGLYAEAEKIFNRLLAGPVPQSVSDRAFFYLARIGYQRGYYDKAWQSLQRIRGPLPGTFEPERRLLASNVLMALGRYGEAVEQLNGWNDKSVWSDYARFNLGVALVRTGAVGPGRQFLEQVGAMAAGDEEQYSLRDRANLALGFAALQQKDPDAAIIALNRVRVDGPFTNKALLGIGWAQSDAKRPEQALSAWLDLRKRKFADAAVEEAYLAVPYAYRQLAANGQAAEQYQLAVHAFAAESQRIDESIAAIRHGGFLDSILEAVPRTNDVGWFWQLQKVPDAPHTRYLYQLLASHEFQEGLKNYRDLRIMQRNLEGWRTSLEAFDSMIAAREQAAMLSKTDLPALEARQMELAARAQVIRNDHDVAALASGEEARQWAALGRIEQTIAAMPAGPQRDSLAERARVLRGTLLWRFDAEYKVRLRSVEKGLQDSADALAEAKLRMGLVQEASVTGPRNTAAFAGRVAGLAARIDELAPRLAAAADAQERVLADIAVGELDAQKKRLASYATQAQFALASIYDKAAAGGTK